MWRFLGVKSSTKKHWEGAMGIIRHPRGCIPAALLEPIPARGGSGGIDPDVEAEGEEDVLGLDLLLPPPLLQPRRGRWDPSGGAEGCGRLWEGRDGWSGMGGWTCVVWWMVVGRWARVGVGEEI